MVRVRLPYGRSPCELELGDAPVAIVEPSPPPPALDAPALRAAIDRALAAPIDAPPLDALARGATRVTIIVSDHTRHEPRAVFLAALRDRLPPGVACTIAIATGTHGPSPLAPLEIDDILADPRVQLVNHDGNAARDLVALGHTSRGTPVAVHRCVVDTDLVIATGCIRPHYFAGYGAGAKAVFPGLGERAAIRTNHRLKTDPRARAGNVIDNPCRADLEEVARAIATPTFLLNGIVGPDDLPRAAVAGDLVHAFRAGAALARTWFTVSVEPAALVIASDQLPVAASLYQAAKIAAAVAPLVRPGGQLVLAAECPDGLGGSLEVIGEAIFRIGILPRLASGVSLSLLSSLSPAIVRETPLEPTTPDAITSVARSRTDSILVVPHASHLIVEAA